MPRPASAGPGAAAAAHPFLLRLFCILLLCSAPSTAGAAELYGRIVGVSDGDTVTLLDRDRTEHRVRLAGIDAPERRQAYGERAKQLLSSLVFGRDVVVVWQKRDRYGRIVGKVLASECEEPRCETMLDVGLRLVAAGLAWHYKQYEAEQNPADRARYAAAEEAARARHAGLWRESTPVPPWHFRRSGRAEANPGAPQM